MRSPPLEGLDTHSERFQLEAFNKARASGGGSAKMGRFLSFGRSPKPSGGQEMPATPENLQLDELLLFSEDSLPVSLLKHNPDNASRAVKMFQSVLQYMGVHGEMLGAMAALELAQKLLHQGLKRVELRDELYMQLIKQTRGNPNPTAKAKAWQLFYLTAATMPPTKDFMSLVSGACWGRGWGRGAVWGEQEQRVACRLVRTRPPARRPWPAISPPAPPSIPAPSCRVCAHLCARGGGGGGGARAGGQDLAGHEAYRQGGPAPHAARHAGAPLRGRCAVGHDVGDSRH